MDEDARKRIGEVLTDYRDGLLDSLDDAVDAVLERMPSNEVAIRRIVREEIAKCTPLLVGLMEKRSRRTVLELKRRRS